MMGMQSCPSQAAPAQSPACFLPGDLWMQLVLCPPADQNGPCRAGGGIFHVRNHRLFLGMWELPTAATRSPKLQMRDTETHAKRGRSPMEWPEPCSTSYSQLSQGSSPGIDAEQDIQDSQVVSGPSVQEGAARDGIQSPEPNRGSARLSSSETGRGLDRMSFCGSRTSTSTPSLPCCRGGGV